MKSLIVRGDSEHALSLEELGLIRTLRSVAMRDFVLITIEPGKTPEDQIVDVHTTLSGPDLLSLLREFVDQAPGGAS
jgi:hypothetical protein